ncbi:MAG: hypothetical protein ACHQ1D_01205 [Nitrososphaerales archaeon]
MANSFAAPVVSDTSKVWWNGQDPEDALTSFRKDYDHPCGLFCAYLYKDANAYSKNEKPLVTWYSKEALKASQR